MLIPYFKKGRGDRRDGWRVQKVDPLFFIIPVVMRTRNDSQCFFSDECDLDILMDFIHRYKTEIPGLSIMHIVIAAMVRTISQRPQTNRFIAGNRVYARNHISCSVTIKREMSKDAEEAVIKPRFDPRDTLKEVVERVNKEVDAGRGDDGGTDTDKVAHLIGSLPVWVIKLVVAVLRWLDNIGHLPKVIEDISPWHSSFYLTNVASLRLGAIYHHLYEFGTCSCFAAIGRPEKKQITKPDGSTETRRTLGVKIVADERICDGYYYADALRLFQSYLRNPERLLVPPEEVMADEGVVRPRMDKE